uniref:hypothetical protein n=1 Tax=Salmonella sp. TaxID=599 RepID=UPI001CD9213B|nr:hypothetical protein [Salmonella sp.]
MVNDGNKCHDKMKYQSVHYFSTFSPFAITPADSRRCQLLDCPVGNSTTVVPFSAIRTTQKMMPSAISANRRLYVLPAVTKKTNSARLSDAEMRPS